MQAYLGGRRVVILNQAHRMTPRPRTPCLTLEEPPSRAWCSALRASAAQLLPTVRLRRQLIQQVPVPDEGARLP